MVGITRHSEVGVAYALDVGAFTPRRCVGLLLMSLLEQLALNEASYIAVRMLQTFGGLENRDDMPWEEGLSVNLTPYHGCKVALKRQRPT